MAQHVLLTVNGTGVPDPYGPGFSSDCGRFLGNPWYNVLSQFWGPLFQNVWRWQPVGYPAAVTPMNPSVQQGVLEIGRLLNLPENQGTFALSGYSQGALVTDFFWRDHLLRVGGSHHHRLDDCIAIVNFGDPMRCPGISRGNDYAGIPGPGTLDGFTTGGIAGPACLKPEETPDFLLSWNLPGDLYGSAPVGDNPWTDEPKVGADETAIYNLIMNMNFKSALDLAKIAFKIIDQPLSQIIPVAEALLNGMKFAAAGTSAPHWQYDPFPAFQYLLERGHEVPPR
jgi:hypothetical protein